jgi:hypothetical protein
MKPNNISDIVIEPSKNKQQRSLEMKKGKKDMLLFILYPKGLEDET